ncbi:MAG: ribonuclease HIII, partial [Opitutales bacterium]
MPKKKAEEGPKRLTSHTLKLDEAQMEALSELCERRMYQYYFVDHTLFAYKAPREEVNIVGYKSGKVVIQGKGTEAFVQNTIEAEITGAAKLGYEEFHNPEWFETHAGLDEAGKGDVFGPLVSCCVIADGDMVREWREKGVKDSKALNDNSIIRLEKIILGTKGVVVKKVFAGMSRYNDLMSRPGANLNKLLAWYHSRALQQALAERRDDVEWGLVDQFSK